MNIEEIKKRWHDDFIQSAPIEKKKIKGVLVNPQTNTFEWASERLTDEQINKISLISGCKASRERFQNIANAKENGKGANKIAQQYRGKSGYSIASIKRILSALAKI